MTDTTIKVTGSRAAILTTDIPSIVNLANEDSVARRARYDTDAAASHAWLQSNLGSGVYTRLARLIIAEEQTSCASQSLPC